MFVMTSNAQYKQTALKVLRGATQSILSGSVRVSETCKNTSLNNFIPSLCPAHQRVLFSVEHLTINGMEKAQLIIS